MKQLKNKTHTSFSNNSIGEDLSGKDILRHWWDYIKNYGWRWIIPMYYDLHRIYIKRKTNKLRKRNEIAIQKNKYKPLKIKDYANWIHELKTDHSHFVKLTDSPYHRHDGDCKIYAFYLPQFYPIPENDSAHGKGFTEWTNVASAIPQYVGHYQPKIPYDLGFYNLLTPGIMERQADLAKTYGVYGFCFYYYWFSGKKLLEKPLERFLHSDIDLHFHFCWATENWSKQWDGGNKEIIVEQHLEEGDAELFFSDLLPFISDPRYERIDGKPLLIVYRTKIFPKDTFISFVERLNTLAKAKGFPGFYLLCTTADDTESPFEYCCDGLIEFPPNITSLIDDLQYAKFPRKVSPYSKFTVFDLTSYLQNKKLNEKGNHFPIFKTCFPGWDNTPRKLYNGGGVYNVSADAFHNWLLHNIQWTRRHNNINQQIVYINAWNEWGEGAILEPTTRYGYQNLQIVKSTLEEEYTLRQTES